MRPTPGSTAGRTRPRGRALAVLALAAALAVPAALTVPGAAAERASRVEWSWTGQAWRPSGKPPRCPSPVISSPVDLARADSRLLPGQYRGGTDPMTHFKAHGGFGFPAATGGAVEVRAPAAGWLVEASRYLEGAGQELQYLLQFQMPCGYLYRLDHLAQLGPSLGSLDGLLPPARLDDSRTTTLDKPIRIAAGQLLATRVGFVTGDNYFVDFGLYFLRRQNTAARTDPAFRAELAPQASLAYYGTCFFDALPAAQRAQALALPLRGAETSSYYCR